MASNQSKNQNRAESNQSFHHGSSDNNENCEAYRFKSERKVMPMKLGEKNCGFCGRNFWGKSKGNCEEHTKKCKKLHKYVSGMNSNICALCKDNREFSSQGQVFSHLEKMHEKHGFLKIPDEDQRSARACKGRPHARSPGCRARRQCSDLVARFQSYGTRYSA